MGVFSKHDQQSFSASETTIIASGAKIEGIFHCQTRLHIDGEVKGEVISKSTITIGKTGKFFGKMEAGKLIVNGTVEGDANCDSVELLSGGIFKGKITSKELMIEAKAKFDGESKIKQKDEVIEKNILTKGKTN